MIRVEESIVEFGWTKARSVGPIAVTIEQAGGSIARVFKKAELPTDVLREPDRPFLLRDQVRLLAFAVDEIGDPALPAKLSTGVGAAGLGPLGRRVCSSGRQAAWASRVVPCNGA